MTNLQREKKHYLLLLLLLTEYRRELLFLSTRWGWRAMPNANSLTHTLPHRVLLCVAMNRSVSKSRWAEVSSQWGFLAHGLKWTPGDKHRPTICPHFEGFIVFWFITASGIFFNRKNIELNLYNSHKMI